MKQDGGSAGEKLMSIPRFTLSLARLSMADLASSASRLRESLSFSVLHEEVTGGKIKQKREVSEQHEVAR